VQLLRKGSFDKVIGQSSVVMKETIESFLRFRLCVHHAVIQRKLLDGPEGASRARGNEQKIVHNYDVNNGHHYGASYIEHTKFRDALLNSTPAEEP